MDPPSNNDDPVLSSNVASFIILDSAVTENIGGSPDPQPKENLPTSTENAYKNDFLTNDLFPRNIDEIFRLFFVFGQDQEEVVQQQDLAPVPPNTSDSQTDTTPLNATDSAPSNSQTSSEYNAAEIFRGGVLRDNTSRACSCGKIQCMRRYCSCYEQGDYCSEACSCKQCLNTKDFAHLLEQSKRRRRDVRVRKTCSCKNAFCEKKYCECFKAGIACSDECKCVTCKNPEGTRYG